MDHANLDEYPANRNTSPEGSVHVEKQDGPGPNMAEGGGEYKSEESERQHLDRLGRERPAKLKSLGAEVFFCYSVIASQFMAVSLLRVEALGDPAD
jgi:hypothetical protein